MASPAHKLTIGIEEEYQIVDPVTHALRPRGSQVLSHARKALGEVAQPELYLSQIEMATPVCRTASLASLSRECVESQIEMATPVCRTLADARAELVRVRRAMITAAAP